jgi:hypothetical protein
MKTSARPMMRLSLLPKNLLFAAFVFVALLPFESAVIAAATREGVASGTGTAIAAATREATAPGGGSAPGAGASEEWLAPAERSAKNSPQPFESIAVGVQFLEGAALGSFDEYWDPTAGGRLEFGTPFYAGVLRAGGHLFGHDSVAPTVPGFLAVYGYLGWAYEWRLPMRFAWSSGVQAGIMYMDFDDDTVHEARRTETEIAFGVDSQVRYGFAARWSAVVTGEYRVVLTDRPIEYVFGGVGLVRTFVTPKWLREFLE